MQVPPRARLPGAALSPKIARRSKGLGLGQPILRILEFQDYKGPHTSGPCSFLLLPLFFEHFLLVLELIPPYISFKAYDSPTKWELLSSFDSSPFCRLAN